MPRRHSSDTSRETPRFPSDLNDATPGRLRLAGRVTRADGATLQLSDALGSVWIDWAKLQANASPGDLLVLDVEWRPPHCSVQALVEHHAAPAPHGSGEFARLRFDAVSRNLAARAAALGAIREYFAAAGFVEVETPARVRSPGLDVHVDALCLGSGSGDGWLVTSPEYHMKRLLVGGMPRVYQLCRCFRADEQGTWHQPEFTMLEWYRAFCGYEVVLDDTEQVVSRVTESLCGKMSFVIGSRSAQRGTGERCIDVTPPYPRLTVREAFRRYAGVHDAVALALQDEDDYFRLLVDRVEPALARQSTPVFLTEFPLSQASLARACPHDPSVAERFELYVAGIELCNGFGELTDPVEQRARLRHDLAERARLGRPPYPIDERFLAALEEGMPPSAGNALGVDRLVALASGAASIAQCQAFPEDRR